MSGSAVTASPRAVGLCSASLCAVMCATLCTALLVGATTHAAAAAVTATVSAGALLVTLELMRSVPTWLRPRRTRCRQGISNTAIGLLAGSGPGWIVLAATTHAAPAAAATSVWFVLHLALWREVHLVDRRCLKPTLSAAAASGAAVAVGWVAGLAVHRAAMVTGATLGTITLTCTALAVRTAFRAPTTTGLSATALAVGTTEGVVYLVGGAGLGGVLPTGTCSAGYLFFGLMALAANGPRLARVALQSMAATPGSLRQRTAT
ncbi:hypothetical protein CLV35_3058 [Motilibacter peucedani]|uniref:Uncharacterized protein n=1 Tax=Motilibacter peucedani TaxID=598650 RepID=A0A420XNF0_9ACTN|nr:hypothetical protein [Motilibacter peucedani]RKS72807.1 hypothetical protein CLV35_3058 [Motilibacter peucedani]